MSSNYDRPWNFAGFPPLPKKEKEKDVIIVEGANKRNYSTGREILAKSFAAATINKVKQVLTLDQLRACGISYINNGIVRTVVDKSVYFINGDRSGFVVEPNDELIEGATDQEQKKLQDAIKNDTAEFQGKPLRVKDLRRKLVRSNKRVEFNDRCQKLLTSTFTFGRNALEIVRFPKGGEWNQFGEPMALKHLSSIRITDAQVNAQTASLEGLFYEPETAGVGTKLIKATDLIPAFHDDNNILDNTYYSGASAVWTILPVAQAIDAINDEDIPEATRQTHSKFGFIYAGTSKKSTLKKIRETIEASTWLVHNEEQLKAQVEDLARDLMELPNVREACAKYICMSTSLPLFLLFEDSANFATANQVMTAYKAGMLKRYRTWFQGIIEKYWYDPILADHLNIPLKDVISADIKIKAIFPDINFETRMDVIKGDQILHQENVMNEIEFAKDIERDDIANRIETEGAGTNSSIEEQKQQSIDEEIQNNNAKTAQDKQVPVNGQRQTNK